MSRTMGVMRRDVPLLNLTPRQQLAAGRLPLRLMQLLVGLWLYGASMAMQIRSALGVGPWDVFHVGVAGKLPLSLGTIIILTGVLVLALWIPLRQWPGIGTVANVIVIGVAADATLAMLPAPTSLPARITLLLVGLVLNGLAGGLYIGSQLGTGPRDGLMTGFARVTGLSIRLIRTGIELTVLAIGWLLGGPVGLGTVLFALLIGPLVQFFLPKVTIDLRESLPATTTEGSGSRRLTTRPDQDVLPDTALG